MAVCSICKGDIPKGEEYESHGEKICEDCYMESQVSGHCQVMSKDAEKDEK